MFDFRQLWEDHKLEVICGSGAIVVLLLNSGNIAKTIAQTNQLRESAQVQEADSARIIKDQLLGEQKTEIANQRYRNNCTVIFSLDRKNNYTVISEGQPVLKGAVADKFRGKAIDYSKVHPWNFLPPGMEVCDADGNTAVLKKDPNFYNLPVATDLAKTGDQALIASARQRARGIYSNHVNK